MLFSNNRQSHASTPNQIHQRSPLGPKTGHRRIPAKKSIYLSSTPPNKPSTNFSIPPNPPQKKNPPPHQNPDPPPSLLQIFQPASLESPQDSPRHSTHLQQDSTISNYTDLRQIHSHHKSYASAPNVSKNAMRKTCNSISRSKARISRPNLLRAWPRHNHARGKIWALYLELLAGLKGDSIPIRLITTS
jgi:hypothetical protein